MTRRQSHSGWTAVGLFGLAIAAATIAASPAHGAGVGQVARSMPWQGVPAVLLDLVCSEAGVPTGAEECPGLTLVIAQIYEGSSVGWSIERLKLPRALESEVRGIARLAQLEIHLARDRLTGATVRTVRDHDAPPPSWLVAINEASTHYDSMKETPR